MVAVAGSVGKRVALAFVEVVESERILIGLKAGPRREIGSVTVGLRDAELVDTAVEKITPAKAHALWTTQEAVALMHDASRTGTPAKESCSAA